MRPLNLTNEARRRTRKENPMPYRLIAALCLCLLGLQQQARAESCASILARAEYPEGRDITAILPTIFVTPGLSGEAGTLAKISRHDINLSAIRIPDDAPAPVTLVFRLTHDLPKENDYFKTDIPGVGLLVRHNGGVYNLKTPFTLGPGQSLHDAGFSRLSLELYQISDDLAPGILDLSRLPGIQLECAEEQAAPAWMVRFGGSLDIHTSTCEVQQDQVVYLGEHSSSSLMREGDNTPWVEFDLRLTNCGQFYGRLTTLHSSNGDLVGGVAASNHAVITGQDHTYATWTGDGWASNYPLDDSKSSSWRGEPLLIQLQMKSSNGQWGDNARRTLYGGGWPQVTEYNVPMRARYYRKNDEEPLEPGPKNASVVVMIRYE